MPVCELDASANVAAGNMFGAQGLVSRNTQTNGLSPAGTLWYAFDERGSVAQRTGSSGGVVSSDLYDAFGNVTSTGGPDVFGFGGQAGYYTDVETGLVLCTNRHYDPQQGRFLTRDPIGYDGGINLYSYTANDPINFSDPLGLWTIGFGGKVGATGGGGGFGLSGGVKFDSTGTVALYGSISAIFGPGSSVNVGPTVSFSPGNLPPPDATGLSKGGGLAFGGSLTYQPVNVSVTVPQNNPVLGKATFTLSPGVGENLGLQGQLGGSIGVNIPTAINNIGKLFRPIGEPFGGDPFPVGLLSCP